MHFPDLAERAFSFLEEEGFSLVETGPAQVSYRSQYTSITIQWDSRSGELNLFFSLNLGKSEKANRFSLTDLLAMEHTKLAEATRPIEVPDENELMPYIERLARDLRLYGGPAMAGDRVFFRRLQVFRTRQARKFTKGIAIKRVRLAAEDAWNKRRFDDLVTLYGSIGTELTELEKTRLEYAKTHQESAKGAKR